MNKAKSYHDFFKTVFVFALLILSACGTSNAETPTATLPVPTITKTPTPTSTVTPSPTATPAFEGLGLSTELVKALKAHTGLESSISEEADGKYAVTATVLSSNGQPVTQSMFVIPSTLSEDWESKNKFGNTPTLQTADGKKLYWIQEQKGWFAVEISADINRPVFVPFNQREVTTRVIIAEFNQPFSQEAIDFWNTSGGLGMGFQFLTVNANTGESTKFGYLTSASTSSPNVTKDNSSVQLIDVWFTTILPDGTQYQYFPTKWLDPLNPRSPNTDEWKIIFVASGQEIMGDDNNRAKYYDLWTFAATSKNRIQVVPIFKVQDGFFNDTNGLITLFVAQPSLQKLLEIPENNMENLRNPGHDMNPYSYTFDYHFPNLASDNAGFGVGIGKDDPKYIHGFFPPEIQKIIFPSMLVFK